jgi:hypothetical protein
MRTSTEKANDQLNGNGFQFEDGKAIEVLISLAEPDGDCLRYAFEEFGRERVMKQLLSTTIIPRQSVDAWQERGVLSDAEAAKVRVAFGSAEGSALRQAEEALIRACDAIAEGDASGFANHLSGLSEDDICSLYLFWPMVRATFDRDMLAEAFALNTDQFDVRLMALQGIEFDDPDLLDHALPKIASKVADDDDILAGKWTTLVSRILTDTLELQSRRCLTESVELKAMLRPQTGYFQVGSAEPLLLEVDGHVLRHHPAALELSQALHDSLGFVSPFTEFHRFVGDDHMTRLHASERVLDRYLSICSGKREKWKSSDWSDPCVSGVLTVLVWYAREVDRKSALSMAKRVLASIECGDLERMVLGALIGACRFEWAWELCHELNGGTNEDTARNLIVATFLKVSHPFTHGLTPKDCTPAYFRYMQEQWQPHESIQAELDMMGRTTPITLIEAWREHLVATAARSPEPIKLDSALRSASWNRRPDIAKWLINLTKP